ncbi:speckle-type POZ protein-like [Oppia nitens]|uniref:speckle-type POZ protein-like n=1 Tax=Oppia nitens TaxID=1686743 RepID=UPI0023D98073|nr:speckle-type POZ protein-like [Oppia nitens]
MFTTDFIEKKNNEVIIDDIDSDVFEQFLQYLYTGNCDKMEINCRENSVPNRNRFGQKSEEITQRLSISCRQRRSERVFRSKLFLSSKSDVFDRMFTTDFIEKKNNEVIIDDIDSDVFEQFLQYLYTGNCDKLYEMLDELLYVADKYMVSSLKTICLNLIF